MSMFMFWQMNRVNALRGGTEMTKNVLVISTSLRKNSNSEVLADSFARGAEEAGHHVEKITLKDKKIAFCKGCMACMKLKACVMKDDAIEIAAKMHDAEVIAFASPIYYYEMSGQMKTLLDRANSLCDSDYKFTDIYMLTAAAEDDEKMLCFGLDRIDKVVPLPSHKYIEYDGDLNERFEDIIGVTLFEDSPVYPIIFWVSDFSKDYVLTKPIHDSQKKVNESKASSLREQYPSLNNGVFLQIDCRDNYELIRELASFGKDLIVLSPSVIQDKVWNRISSMNEEYLKIRNSK